MGNDRHNVANSMEWANIELMQSAQTNHLKNRIKRNIKQKNQNESIGIDSGSSEETEYDIESKIGISIVCCLVLVAISMVIVFLWNIVSQEFMNPSFWFTIFILPFIFLVYTMNGWQNMLSIAENDEPSNVKTNADESNYALIEELKQKIKIQAQIQQDLEQNLDESFKNYDLERDKNIILESRIKKLNKAMNAKSTKKKKAKKANKPKADDSKDTLVAILEERIAIRAQENAFLESRVDHLTRTINENKNDDDQRQQKAE